MRDLSLTMLLTCGLVLGATPDAPAQIGYLWTYDELWQKADVVVVAKCIATLDTGRQASHPALSPALPVVEMRTTFRVEATFRADAQTGVGVDVTLRHYQLDMERWRKEHPPEPGKPPPGVLNTGSQLAVLEGRSYLLFLKRSVDGVYEPLSGHTFPTNSVYLLDHEVGRLPAFSSSTTNELRPGTGRNVTRL
jgi:hypothetical protein